MKKTEAEPFSLKIPADVELDLNINLNSQRLYSEFYAGYSVVGELRRQSRVVRITVEGELRVSLGENNYRGGRASEEFIERGLKDADLAEMMERDEFENCNWFNLYAGQTSNSDDVNTQEVISTLDEAIVQAVSLITCQESEWQKEMFQGVS